MALVSEGLRIAIGGAQITLQKVVLNPDVTLDEIRLDGTNLTVTQTQDAKIAGDLGEVRVRIVMAEPNVNRALTAYLSPDFPIKSLSLRLFSDKVKITGNFVKGFFSLPIAIDSVIKVRNGVELYFDLTGIKAGFGMPPAVVEVIEGQLNATLRDAIAKHQHESPIPFYIDEVRTEPGRLIALGKAQLRF